MRSRGPRHACDMSHLRSGCLYRRSSVVQFAVGLVRVHWSAHFISLIWEHGTDVFPPSSSAQGNIPGDTDDVVACIASVEQTFLFSWGRRHGSRAREKRTRAARSVRDECWGMGDERKAAPERDICAPEKICENRGGGMAGPCASEKTEEKWRLEGAR